MLLLQKYALSLLLLLLKLTRGLCGFCVMLMHATSTRYGLHTVSKFQFQQVLTVFRQLLYAVFSSSFC